MQTIKFGLAITMALSLSFLAVPVRADAGANTINQDNLESSRSEDCGDRELHPPVEIAEDHGLEGFTWTNPLTGEDEYRPGSGVVAGDGSEEDPYVIEEWCIETGPSDGIVLMETQAHVVIRGNVVLGTSGRAMEAAGLLGTVQYTGFRGIGLREAANVAVEDNVVHGASYGIHAHEADGLIVRGNTLTINVWNGILIDSSEAVRIADNTVTGNGGFGIWFWRSQGVVKENAITENLSDGIRLQRAYDFLVEGNSIARNEGPGIGFHRNTIDGIVRKNTINDNQQAGVQFKPHLFDTLVPERNLVEANVIENNKVGISIEGPKRSDNVIRYNNIQNHADGIGLDATDSADVDARDNWWGCADGPDAIDCDGIEPEGGATAFGAVSYEPWLTEPNNDAGADD